MKILLITPGFSVEKTKGLARYSSEIYKRLHKKIKVDLILRRGFHSGLFGFIFSFFYSNFLSLIKGWKYDVIHILSPEQGFLASLFYRKKTVVTIHDLFPILYWKKLKYKVGILIHLLSYLIWKIAMRSRIIVANSSLTKNQIKKVFKRFDIKIISEGIDEKIRRVRQKNNFLTLCFVGNLSYRKRVDIAIHLLKKIKELRKKIKVKLIIVGGKLKSIYQVNFDLSKINDKDILIFDAVDDKKLIEIYSISHFLIFPSMIEGFALPILEAIKCDVLPITFKFSDIPRETKKLSVECEDIEDAIKKILYLWKRKKELKKLLKKFKKELKKFNWNDVCKRYLKLYKGVVIYGKG